MLKLTPYLGFDGNCAEAMRFYEQALGAKIEMMLSYGDSPMAEQTPVEHRQRILHSTLRLPGGGQLYAADKSSGMAGCDAGAAEASGFNGIAIALDFDDVAAGEAAFEALARGGSVSMPMAASFWIERFGMLTDRYGVDWLVNAGASKM